MERLAAKYPDDDEAQIFHALAINEAVDLADKTYARQLKAGAILERVIVLYEACNFQDLTGQRINKIVNVLKFVEERLDKMIDVWGGLEAFKTLAGQDGPRISEDDHKSLLNGPKLDEDAGHVDQTDIDALFN